IVPATIFSQQTGSFEAIVKYLKENRELSYNKIAEILGRNYQTIVTAHKKAIQKNPLISQSPYTKYTVDISKLKDRSLSVLEHVSVQLKEQGLNFSEIARQTARDPRTIWTTYTNAVKKSGQNKNASS
ncbi:MAG: hypothetical protein AABX39_01990, partial [Nanoarchaeota archaeon]